VNIKQDDPGAGGTLIVDRYVKDGALSDAGSNNYKGLRIHALPGLHARIGEMVQQHFPVRGALLDLAAGSGAMSLRMQDHGYSVAATDYVGSAFKLHGSIPFTECDLNSDFATRFPDRFDYIVASEIIEHLENPRHFARQAFALLKPGGRMLLSTPNIESSASKVMFLTAGRFLWFGDQQYASDGHITPLSHWQIGCAMKEAGFDEIAVASFGDATRQLQGSPRLAFVARLFDLLPWPSKLVAGDIFMTLVEKPTVRNGA
jgi:SAM-dependent methyltransferase